jgi:hypothetical protein
MTYKIRLSPFSRTVAKNLATIDAARDFLAGWGKLVAFEVDPDGHDAADAALLRKGGGGLEIYVIERED